MKLGSLRTNEKQYQPPGHELSCETVEATVLKVRELGEPSEFVESPFRKDGKDCLSSLPRCLWGLFVNYYPKVDKIIKEMNIL